jgi:hypothetical protein
MTAEFVPIEQARREARRTERASTEDGQQEERSRPPRKLKTTWAPELAGKPLPERQWIVPGWIPDRAVTLLGGDGGVGKSLLVLQLMASSALSKPWLGLPAKSLHSFALFCEDPAEEIHLRLSAIARDLGTGFEEMESVRWAARAGQDSVLMAFPENGRGKPTPLWYEFRQAVMDHGAQLVIVDTLADTFAGNENHRGQARAFINLLRGLALEIDGAVILTAHPSLSGQSSGTGLSGNTAWNNSVRSRLYLTRPKEEGGIQDRDARALKRMKANYSSEGDSLGLQWRDGVLVREDAASPSGIVGAIEIENAVIAVLRSRMADGGRVAADPKARNSLANAAKETPNCRRYSWSAVCAAQARLIDRGKIVRVELGPPSKRYVFVRPADLTYPGELAGTAK